MKDKRSWGWVALAVWAFLILAGIVAKRMYGHPNWMVFFHLPAAVALVLAFRILSAPYRRPRALELALQMKSGAEEESSAPRRQIELASRNPAWIPSRQPRVKQLVQRLQGIDHGEDAY
jgi:hypothetical protein